MNVLISLMGRQSIRAFFVLKGVHFLLLFLFPIQAPGTKYWLWRHPKLKGAAQLITPSGEVKLQGNLKQQATQAGPDSTSPALDGCRGAGLGWSRLGSIVTLGVTTPLLTAGNLAPRRKMQRFPSHDLHQIFWLF